jgi:hypothetical protein
MRISNLSVIYNINPIFFICLWNLSIVSSKNPVIVTDNIPCSEIVNNTCICTRNCLEPYNTENNTYCKVSACSILEDNICKSTGKNYLSALVFSVIPITQPLGIGYAAIDRWDLVGIQLMVTFGPFLVFCCVLCGYISYEIKKKEDNTPINKDQLNTVLFTQLFQCSHSILLTTFWIMSIIDMSTPNSIKDGNGCYLSGFG